MSVDKKLKILKKVLGRFWAKTDEYLFFCPKCGHHKQKLSVNISKNVFKCWVCDWSGKNVSRIVRNYGKSSDKLEWGALTQSVEIETFHDKLFATEKEEAKADLSLPDEFISLANKNLPKTALYPLNYLSSRGVTKKDIIKWKIGYCSGGEYAGRVVIPSFDCDGDLNFFVTRSYDRSWRKYMNPRTSKNIIFNHLYLDFSKEIVLVEGVFDAIVAGDNSIPLLGSTMTERSKLLHEIVKNDTPVCLALDPDARKKTDKIIKLLLKHDIEAREVSVSPFSDVGEMPKEQFAQRRQSAEVLNLDNYLLSKIRRINL